MQRSTSAFAFLASALVHLLSGCVASTPDSSAPRATPSGGANNASSGGAMATGGSTGGYISAGTGGGVANSGGAGGIATGGSSGSVQAGGTAGSSTGTGTGGASGAGGAAGSGGTSGAGGSGGSAGGSNGTPDCNSVTTEPIITVAKNGSADFQTVQAAIDSLSTGNTTPTQIRIAPGTYQEKLRIDRPYVTLCGEPGQASATLLTYSDNANTPNGNGGTLGTTGGASTNLSSSNVSAENITFANSTPLGGSQAVALLVSGDQVQFRNCRFMSYQDTLYVRKAKQYFKDCYVQGSVDYIFGDGTSVFENCTVHSAAGGVAVTAPSTAETVAYGLVFLGGELTAAASVAAGSVTLGRNWGAYGAAAYIGTTLGAHIKPVGWMAMGTNTLDTARFVEYQTSGDGATPSAIAARAPQSTQLSAAEAADYDLESIFGSWTPSFSQ